MSGKAPPIAWLNQLFAQYKPYSALFHYVDMDQGGEMAKNLDFLSLFEKARLRCPAHCARLVFSKRPW
jgi:hypothetical protein